MEIEELQDRLPMTSPDRARCSVMSDFTAARAGPLATGSAADRLAMADAYRRRRAARRRAGCLNI